jgi:heme-degrading monooxygenase HmoA
MTETVTTGTWWVEESKTAAFLDAWAAFAAWTGSLAGAGTLRLGRDRGEPTRYVSFATWEDLEAVRAWKAMPEMRERLAAVVQHVDDFHSDELELVVSVTNAASATNGRGQVSLASNPK